MHLCEEYLQRHSLNFPLVKYVGNGTLFTKTGKCAVRCDNCGEAHSTNWLVHSVYWEEPFHPGLGHFVMESKIPVHNGYMDFHPLVRRNLFWDEYEDFLIEWSEGVDSSTVVLDEQEVILTAWEMFLLCTDKELATSVHVDRIFPSIDLDLSVPERHSRFLESLQFLSEKHTELFKIWKYGMIPYVTDYAYWLGELASNGKTVFANKDM
jgi:hypothetical protein